MCSTISKEQETENIAAATIGRRIKLFVLQTQS
jgi:hypothetical protein